MSESDSTGEIDLAAVVPLCTAGVAFEALDYFSIAAALEPERAVGRQDSVGRMLPDLVPKVTKDRVQRLVYQLFSLGGNGAQRPLFGATLATSWRYGDFTLDCRADSVYSQLTEAGYPDNFSVGVTIARLVSAQRDGQVGPLLMDVQVNHFFVSLPRPFMISVRFTQGVWHVTTWATNHAEAVCRYGSRLFRPVIF